MHYEEDCIGRLAVDDNVLYGIHTMRALTNFPIRDEATDTLLFRSLIVIKKAAAAINAEAGTLDAAKAQAITDACNALLLGKHQDALVAPAIQGSAGTSVNMNVNEVLAKLGMRLHPELTLHPNDDVNQSQSTNDTYPTAGRMSLLMAQPALLNALAKLCHALLTKADDYAEVVKVGRTQLQDATPLTWGMSFRAYTTMLTRDMRRIKQAGAALAMVNLGGTAVGTGLNASDYYRSHIVARVAELSELPLQLADDLIDATQNADDYVQYSGALKALAVDLTKLCNDLRLLGSGPQAGFNELKLPPRQAGSSIMPGKVNPVIPEVVNQVAFEVMGHDLTVTMAASAGQLELNAFEPIIFRDLRLSQDELNSALRTLCDNCIAQLRVNTSHSIDNVQHSAVAATVLNPYLGYTKTTALIQKAVASGRSVPALLKAQRLMPDSLISHLFSPAVLTNRMPAATKERRV
ncbi:aspartate ammonia-lyase [Lacticaseibacillus jixiensis]|uniref:aspartate ammonia-lyase n=1 Tax=Lacticaseibacillus jixiensis TaxID=3231926 RepID=UPI0036F3AED2